MIQDRGCSAARYPRILMLSRCAIHHIWYIADDGASDGPDLYTTRSFAVRKSTFYLPERLQAEFEFVAKRQEKSMAAIIRTLIEGYVSEHKPAKPRGGIGSDHEVTSTNYREWLRENWHPE